VMAMMMSAATTFAFIVDPPFGLSLLPHIGGRQPLGWRTAVMSTESALSLVTT
jgi:hypothetical protein